MEIRPALGFDANEGPLPLTPNQERDALTFEFQRLVARLTHARIISREGSTHLVRFVSEERRRAESQQDALLELICAIVVALEDGKLERGRDFVDGDSDCIALHPETTVRTLYREGYGSWPPEAMRKLMRFGSRHFGDVVRGRSVRMLFGTPSERRRTVLVHLPAAYEFAGLPQKPVPLR